MPYSKLKYTLKQIALYGIGYFIVSVLFSLIFKEGETLSTFLFQSIFFGLFMGSIFSFLELSYASEIGLDDIEESDLKTNYDTEIETDLGLSDIHNIVAESHHFRKARLIKKSDHLLIKTELDLFKRGSNIKLMKTSPSTLRIQFKKPRLRNIIVNGMNHLNAQALEQLLKTES